MKHFVIILGIFGSVACVVTALETNEFMTLVLCGFVGTISFSTACLASTVDK